MIDKKNKKPLEGVVVLAVEQFEAAPTGTMILADFGADVIKVEHPEHGDQSRKMGPWVLNKYGEKVGGFYFRFNRNKKSIALNLKTQKGKEIFLQLVKSVDVVVENFRPGVMDRLGLGYEVLKEIKPELIHMSISGFGHTDIYQSPFTERPAFDLIAQAMSGLMRTVSKSGNPEWVGFPIGDQIAGIMGAMGVLVALFHRQRTGEGQRVDISLYDSTVLLNERWVNIFDVTGVLPTDATAISSSPYGAYRAKDGFIVISGGQSPVWPHFCEAIDRMDLLNDPNFKTMQDRAKNHQQIKKIVEDWLNDKTVEEALNKLLSCGVPAAPANNVRDILHCPHLNARKMIYEYDSPYSGKRRVIGNPIKLSRMSEEVRQTPPPEIGEHTEEILTGMLGLSCADIQMLQDEGVINKPGAIKGKD